MFVDGYQEGFWVIWISCLLQDKEQNNSKQMQSDVVSREPLILAKCLSEQTTRSGSSAGKRFTLTSKKAEPNVGHL